MKSIKELKEICKIIPHSESRMPYTYHHDAIRVFTRDKTGVLHSRSDIAGISSNTSQEELYTIALFHVLNDLKPVDWLCIPSKYIQDLKDIYLTAQLLMDKFYRDNYGKEL